SAGMMKLKTLGEAAVTLQKLHALVERMAIEVKAQRAVGMIPQQVKRVATPLQGQLKGQFSLIADQVAQLILVAGRGGSDQVRLRALRELVAQLRTMVELAEGKVREQHAVPIENIG
ncbi:MAG: hypothetical protein P3A29_08715, partial [Gemmatimonadota bacterium]|nr:hypothetical protein [Gemmatimonadota bacterium]